MNDEEIKQQILEDNVNRIINLTKVVLNHVRLSNDTEIKIAYTRIHDDAMLAKRLIDKA